MISVKETERKLAVWPDYETRNYVFGESWATVVEIMPDRDDAPSETEYVPNFRPIAAGTYEACLAAKRLMEMP